MVDGNITVQLSDGVIAQNDFYDCLNIWYEDSSSRRYQSSLVWKNGILDGATMSAQLNKLEDALDSI